MPPYAPWLPAGSARKDREVLPVDSDPSPVVAGREESAHGVVTLRVTRAGDSLAVWRCGDRTVPGWSTRLRGPRTNVAAS